MESSDKELRDALRVWIGGFLWNHVATLTTKDPRSRAHLLRDFQRRFVRKLERAAQGYVAWFVVIEESAPRHWHLHVALAGTASLTIKMMQKAWRLGFTRITLLENPPAAIGYLVKELQRFPENFDISPRLFQITPAGVVLSPRRLPKGEV
jgi:hypothetical protein